jgi:hypothetical protein
VVRVFLTVDVGRFRQWHAYSKTSQAHPIMGALGQSPLFLLAGGGEAAGQAELVMVVVAILSTVQRGNIWSELRQRRSRILNSRSLSLDHSNCARSICNCTADSSSHRHDAQRGVGGFRSLSCSDSDRLRNGSDLVLAPFPAKRTQLEKLVGQKDGVFIGTAFRVRRLRGGCRSSSNKADEQQRNEEHVD